MRCGGVGMGCERGVLLGGFVIVVVVVMALVFNC